MNLPFFKLNWLTLVCVLFLAACTTDDDSPSPAGNTPGFVLSKVIFAGQDTTIYEYDAQKRLTKAFFEPNLTVTSRYYKEFAYDAQGRIVKSNFKLINGNLLSYQVFDYTNQLLTKISFYNRSQPIGDFTHEYDQTLEYNAKNQIVKVITRKPNQPAEDYRVSQYEYNGAGDVIKQTDFVNQTAGLVKDYNAEYTYDDKNNPYQQATLFGIGALTLSSHNIVSEKETYPLSGQVKNTNRTYTYNEAGLPTKEMRTSNTNSFEIQNYYQVLQ